MARADDFQREGTQRFYEMKFLFQLKTLGNPVEILGIYNLFALALLIYSGFAQRAIQGVTIADIGIVLVFVVPNIPRYLNYYRLSSDLLVVVNDEERGLTVWSSGSQRSYPFDEIKSITKVMMGKDQRRKKSKPRWGDFFYYDITIENGDEIIITSLMTYDGQIEIDDVRTGTEAYAMAWVHTKGRRIMNLEMNTRKG